MYTGQGTRGCRSYNTNKIKATAKLYQAQVRDDSGVFTITATPETVTLSHATWGEKPTVLVHKPTGHAAVAAVKAVLGDKKLRAWPKPKRSKTKTKKTKK